MHALRTSSTLARLVLAWLLLTLGVAVAAPLVQPQAMEIVCSTGAGAKVVWVATDDNEAPLAAPATLECLLCLGASAPPAAIALPTLGPVPQAQPPALRSAVRIVATHGAPLPARGPPTLG